MKNIYKVDGKTTTIFIKRRNGEVVRTLIDTEDLEKVKSYKGTWHAQWKAHVNSFYVAGSIKKTNKKYGKVHLHRLIMDCPEGYVVDHINHDTVDNRKYNLRVVTQAENSRNRKDANYSGVTWNNKDKRFRARIQVNKKEIWIGNFKCAKEAREAVKRERKKHQQIGGYYD